MEQERIEKEMHELEKKLEYKFNNIFLLAEAMKSQKLEKLPEDGDNQNEYSNESLAFLGDTIIKFLIAEFLYKNKAGEDKRKGKMTELKARLENNKVFHRIMTEEKLILYSYHDKHFNMDNPPDHEKVVSKKHDPYIEAIAAAIYMDGGWNAATTWFKGWLLPRLEQYQDNLT
jgi:dsRNA-specific ribonuclease